ncbi:hypothetical protein CSUI_001788, partial [Cystoisospora suis]
PTRICLPAEKTPKQSSAGLPSRRGLEARRGGSGGKPGCSRCLADCWDSCLMAPCHFFCFLFDL